MTNQENKLRHFDTFSGFGGFSLGLKRSYENNSACGAEVDRKTDTQGNSSLPESGDEKGGQRAITIGFSEIDKYASAVLRYHWPNTKNYGDITKINWSEVPDFDLLTGGSPCQDLSIAGKRAGLDGARSGLFFEYMRAVREKKPKYFIWENVKGTLSSNSGWDFATVLNEMAEAGYSLWWQVLNAKDFGVPQNRERIFVVGFRDRPAPEVFFERADPEQNLKQVIGGSQGYRVYDITGTGVSLASQAGGVGAKTGLYAKTIRVGGQGSPYGSKQNWDSYKIDGRIRRLTPIECERLMGLDDGWTSKGIIDGKEVEISDSQRYKLCGNGVVVNVVEKIIKELIINR